MKLSGRWTCLAPDYRASGRLNPPRRHLGTPPRAPLAQSMHEPGRERACSKPLQTSSPAKARIVRSISSGLVGHIVCPVPRCPPAEPALVGAPHYAFRSPALGGTRTARTKPLPVRELHGAWSGYQIAQRTLRNGRVLARMGTRAFPRVSTFPRSTYFWDLLA